MAERKNTGLAVSHAKRLNDCYIELSAAIAGRPATKKDRALWRHDYESLAAPEREGREDWIHRCGSSDVAFIALRGAVRNGHLPLWTYGPHGEAEVDRDELKELTLRTFKWGTYQPDNRVGSELAEPPLWVKKADWKSFMLDLWALRYGIDWANPAPPADTPKLPPEGQFVTLSHALSWIGFGVSMSNNHLGEVLSQDLYGEHDPQEVITAALEKLLTSAGAERIVMRGKYRPSRDDGDATLLTDKIDPMKFDDYRQFSYLEDELRHGRGLLFWHDGEQVFHDTFGGGRKDSYVKVTVNRADLLREFPPKKVAPSGGEHFRVGHTFTRDDPAAIAPWWSVNQALAWVSTRIPSYVEYIGSLERDEPREYRPYFVQAICETQMAGSDEAQAFLESRRASWPNGTFFAHAGRALLEKILAGDVRPMTREDGQGRRMRSEEFVGIGLKETGADWLDLAPQPLFSSCEVREAFPAGEEATSVSAAAVTSVAGTENECRDWLVKEFAADSSKQRPKSEFRRAALSKFAGKLSARGFDYRVWAPLAQQHGRSGAGAKKKS